MKNNKVIDITRMKVTDHKTGKVTYPCRKETAGRNYIGGQAWWEHLLERAEKGR